MKAYTSRGRLVYACLCPLGEHVIPFVVSDLVNIETKGAIYDTNKFIDETKIAFHETIIHIVETLVNHGFSLAL